MRIVFWQNSLSPHQLPYITQLIENNNVNQVIIAVPYTVNSSRKAMGWNIEGIPNSPKLNIYINPDKQTIDRLLKEAPENSYHFFSGIRGFKFIFEAFKQSLKYNIKRGLITERPNTFGFGLKNGKPLWLHKIRFFLQDKKFIQYITYVFAMGDDAVKYYQSISSEWKVFHFAYCTQINNENYSLSESGSYANFAFLGSLEWWKAPHDILKALHFDLINQSNFNYHMYFIGGGRLLCKLKKYIEKKTLKNIFFLGYKPNSEATSILEKKDILILPSVYDGWGAVVNEALGKGLYIICSDKCGAKELLSNPLCGQVFKAGNYRELANIILYCTQNIERIRKNKEFRRNWALTHISGKIIANYFIDCLNNENAQAPWLLK